MPLCDYCSYARQTQVFEAERPRTLAAGDVAIMVSRMGFLLTCLFVTGKTFDCPVGTASKQHQPAVLAVVIVVAVVVVVIES